MSDYISKQALIQEYKDIIKGHQDAIQGVDMDNLPREARDSCIRLETKIEAYEIFIEDLNASDQGEAARLREHIKGIHRIISSGYDSNMTEALRSVLISAEWACADALSSGDTEPVVALKVRELLSKHQGMNLHDVTMRNVLKEIAPLFGINTGEGKA